MRDSALACPYDPEIETLGPIRDAALDNMERHELLLHEAFIKVPGATWQEKLDHCKACKCCTRHQTFRPRRLVPWTDEMAERDVKIHYLKTCECNCRHIARFICRNMNEKCPVAEPMVEEEM